jgi:putative phage-type endonuclease
MVDIIKKILEIDTKEPITDYMEQVAFSIQTYKVKNKSRFNFEPSSLEIRKLKERVPVLRNKPQPEQRSKEWHEFRNGREMNGRWVGGHLTASDTGTILGLNNYSNKEEVFAKKIGLPSFSWSLACEHGIKYEEITAKIYEEKNNVKIEEFGCIEDEDDVFIAASPDGITPSGDMIEIKNVASRKIDGIPKAVYYAQMQQQLHVCKLNRCIFIETEIREYNNFKEYCEDVIEDYENEAFSRNEQRKGVLIEITKKSDISYIYTKNLDIKTNCIKNWIDTEITKLGDLGEYDCVRPIYWHCNVYSCIHVYYDHKWWDDNFGKLKEFWDELERIRSSPQLIEELRNKKSKKKPKKKKKSLKLKIKKKFNSNLFEDSDSE